MLCVVRVFLVCYWYVGVLLKCCSYVVRLLLVCWCFVRVFLVCFWYVGVLLVCCLSVVRMLFVHVGMLVFCSCVFSVLLV